MRVGLIALSGVRACDEELMRLGMTLPGFVERSKVIASLPSLGLLTLAGMTPHEHDCVYFEIEDVRAMGELPEGLDLVAISSFTAQIGEAYELADRFRERRVPVVMGGLHVTALPQEAGRHADAVVIGEGEACWEQVLEDADRGRLQQVYRSDGGFDLGQTRMPAYELLDINRYNRLTVQTSRGC
ncbi:MAG: B12-binding domain-containing radical SAM protein, partial [Planctomycetota bacterium]